MIIKSPNKKKKFRVIFKNGHKTDFGAAGYSDYTIHKNKERMERYLARHKKRENWSKKGIHTAGFWSRWLLWSKPSLTQAIKHIEKSFKVKLRYRSK